MARSAEAAAEKRRAILDAAVRVFARQGFHTCRVSDNAHQAGVANGLVYHYFRPTEELLDALFLERWDLLLAAIREVEAKDAPAREQLLAIAGFIVDSYHHDPDVMKVVVVEVTRAANTFGQRHWPKIHEAYDGIARIVEAAQRRGEFRTNVTPDFAAMAFYGAIEQVLTGWIFAVLPQSPQEMEEAKRQVVETICGGLDDARVG
jgi:AcrR family transcriptional regulator